MFFFKHISKNYVQAFLFKKTQQPTDLTSPVFPISQVQVTAAEINSQVNTGSILAVTMAALAVTKHHPDF